jgi:hypothetical protein
MDRGSFNGGSGFAAAGVGLRESRALIPRRAGFDFGGKLAYDRNMATPANQARQGHLHCCGSCGDGRTISPESPEMETAAKLPAICTPLAGSALVAVSLLCAVARGGEPISAADARPQAVPDAKWDAVFDRTSGWTGGDGVGTVDLGHGRVLWLFGDTWIGEVAAGSHVPGSQMVNNSLGLHGSESRKMGDPPARGEMRFYWGQNDARGRPTAWIVPDPLRVKNSTKRSDPEHPCGWYWPTGGAVVAPGPQGRPRLLVFLFHIGKAEDRTGIWAFKSLGGALAIIDNFDQPVEKWHVEQHEISSAINTDMAKADSGLRETSWGMAAIWQPAETKNTAGVVYVYGIRDQSPLNRQLLLARVPADAAQESGKWRFYTGGGKWSNRLRDAAPVAEDLVSELSVEEYAAGGRRMLVMVHSEPLFGRRIFVRTAARPEGPWASPTPIYTVAELDRNRTYFTYAAKGHMQLSRPGELLISYVVNSQDFGAMFKDAAIYRPRFIRTSPIGWGQKGNEFLTPR